MQPVPASAGPAPLAPPLPLAGRRVVVTRAQDQADSLSRLLQQQGAQVLELPCVKIVPPSRREPLIEALAGLGCYDWMVFTSANGVTAFFDSFFKAFEDLRDLGGARFAAVGPATAARLSALHLKVDLVPREHTAQAIARELAACGSLENTRLLLLRAEVATPELPALLEHLGAIVDDVPCYRTVAETELGRAVASDLAANGADWITFTSGSTVTHFHARLNLPELKRRFPRLRLASLGPETTQALVALGLNPDVEATPHTLPGLVTALVSSAAAPPGP